MPFMELTLQETEAAFLISRLEQPLPPHNQEIPFGFFLEPTI
jgi:hypothetical protein